MIPAATGWTKSRWFRRASPGGLIVGGELKVNLRRDPSHDFVLRDGKVWDKHPREVITQFTRDDIFVKGANAIDSSGEAAVFAAGADSGTIGYALPHLMARDANLIVPCSIGKMVSSVADAVQECGIYNFKYSTGYPCALIPLVKAKVVTEIEALGVLFDVDAIHVGSGGIGGSEGSIVLVIEGAEEDVDQAMEFIKTIKGEPGIPAPEVLGPPASDFNFDAKAQWDDMIRRTA